jgi:hypothetical protein
MDTVKAFVLKHRIVLIVLGFVVMNLVTAIVVRQFFPRHVVKTEFNVVGFDYKPWDARIRQLEAQLVASDQTKAELARIINTMRTNEQNTIKKDILDIEDLRPGAIDTLVYDRIVRRADSLRKAGHDYRIPAGR